MFGQKKSFFDKITSIVNQEAGEDVRELEVKDKGGNTPDSSGWIEEEASEGQLTIDMYQGPDEIVIQTMVAGVRPEDLNVSIGRDMVTIKGKRESQRNVNDEDFFYKELYWGSFSRTILLPHEVDVDAADASEKNGLLTLKLPKIDKARQTKVKIKSH
ncbi:MAG: Hsp20/alpha crystallin family protein [Parcubacteria group bacterium]|nr:Hsp20/alpha crystallin family protein [Parcubacteria group bacterium]